MSCKLQLKEFVVRRKVLIFKIALRGADLFKMHSLIAVLLDKFVSDIGPEGPLKKACRSGRRNVTTILFLNYHHYPEVAKLLATRDDLRCVAISWELLRYLLAAFVRQPTIKEKNEHTATLGFRHEFRMAGPGTKIYRGRKKYRAFLRKFLPNLLERHGIDLVFNSDARYRREADFSRVASELGYPHICMPRDSMFIIPSTFENSVRRHRTLGTFHGHQLLVQNEATRQVFLQSGHARDDQITVLGAIRLDGFIQRVKSGAGHSSNRKTVAIFTWPLDRRARDGSVVELQDVAKSTIRAMARLAMRRSDVDFVVKLKGKHIQNGTLDSLRRIVVSVVGASNGLKKFAFYGDEVSAADVIFNASVVCGMQSTTVLEAAVARKPVILPHFKELRETHGADEVLMYGDCRDLFDIPNDENDLIDMVERRLEDGSIPDDRYQAMIDLFERHIAPLSGDGLEKCVNILTGYAEAGRQRRDSSSKMGANERLAHNAR